MHGDWGEDLPEIASRTQAERFTHEPQIDDFWSVNNPNVSSTLKLGKSSPTSRLSTTPA